MFNTGLLVTDILSRMRKLLELAWPIAVIILFSGCSVNPATGKQQFNLVSEAQEIALGQEADPSIVAQYGVYQDPDLEGWIDTLGQQIAAISERPELPWTFRLLDDPLVNAFALPGGFIYLTRGILAHLGSEAEVVGVLGHEVGHVTARHGASQMSKGMLAQVGLGAASIAVSPELGPAVDALGSGMGLLFLKFGRDDERQADSLGVRYSLATGFDPRSLADVFDTLDRVSGGEEAGRPPGWLSTHPSPGNRQQLLDAEVARLNPRLDGLKVGELTYLKRLDGMSYGDDPRKGYFDGAVFIQPEMKFSIEFPGGWRTMNSNAAVVGLDSAQKAMLRLSFGQGTTASQAASSFFKDQAVTSTGRASAIKGFKSEVHLFHVEQGEGDLVGLVAFIEHDGRVYQWLGFTAQSSAAQYSGPIESSIKSFRALSSSFPKVEPMRLKILRLEKSTTLAAWVAKHGGPVEATELARINGADPDEVLEAGHWIKLVEGSLPSRSR